MIEHLRNHPACHERLTETDLVGHQEAAGRVWCLVESLEGVLNGVALESLEVFEDGVGVRALARFSLDHDLSASRAAHSGSHISLRPSGRRSFPSGIFWRSEISRAASSIRLGLLLRLWRSASNRVALVPTPEKSSRSCAVTARCLYERRHVGAFTHQNEEQELEDATAILQERAQQAPLRFSGTPTNSAVTTNRFCTSCRLSHSDTSNAKKAVSASKDSL